MSCYVSMQHQWPTGDLIVKIAPGLDYAGPGMLTEPAWVKGLTGNRDDPREGANW